MLIDFSGVIALAAALLLIFILLLLKFKLKKSYMYLFFFSIFYIYLCYVLDYTQFPIIIDENMKNEIGQNVWADANLIPFNPNHFAIKPSLLNVLLTIPFGFGICFILKVNFKQIALLGVLLGICLESLQLIIALIVGFTTRYVDVNDLILNFSGVILGYGVFKIFMISFKSLIEKFDVSLNSFLKYIYDTK
ncbi:VanZ family protein [Paraliobacillus ryukyuensis]|uniref:VanZ family protein n=1 Tax=Paraliobacillus ryukyuensis TaxID=200904 RepID=UPI0009A86FBF|nr:VanZ family protein [Paraliobacillus ryukyuensis]